MVRSASMRGWSARPSVITGHVHNVFREGELAPDATCARFAQVQTEGERTFTRDDEHYNLDVIISVGYRVKSRQGTRFRLWATRGPREHLVQGYSYNQTRLAEGGLKEARQTLDPLARTVQNQALVDDTGRAKRRPPICSIPLSRITRSRIATSVSVPFCSFAICKDRAWRIN